MILSVRASAVYELPADTFILLMVEPHLSGDCHVVTHENLLTTPTPYSELRQDVYGNPQRRLLASAGQFSFDFEATVEVKPNAPLPEDAEEHSAKDLPAETIPFTMPSRYCQSDMLVRFAGDEFGGMNPGGGRVNAIADWVRKHVEYRYGTTDSSTSAYDTVTQRIGVCRDFAHLVIAICRALNIPARYVSGYALDLEPPDFHGFVQVFVGGQWYNIDATYEGLRPALVPIAVGRDAADVAMMTLFGAGIVKEQSVEVRRKDK